MFAVPFDEVARILGREPAAVRQLASRGRRRVQGAGPTPEADLGKQRVLADAFLAASRGGDRAALLAVLDPDVVLRVDAGFGGPSPAASKVVRGAEAVVAQALMFSSAAPFAQPALVNGAAGLITIRDGVAVAVMSVTVSDGKIVELNILADPARLRGLDVSVFS
jgi:RNA polymerase sigma-70 factor (ECF subfamily)